MQPYGKLIQAKKAAAQMFVDNNTAYIDCEENGFLLTEWVDKIEGHILSDSTEFSTLFYFGLMQMIFNQRKKAFKTVVTNKTTKRKWNKQLTQEYLEEIEIPSESDTIFAHGLGVQL